MTGASGFLGGNLVRFLVDRGDDVRVLLDEGQSSPALSGLVLERVEGSVSRNTGLREALDGVADVYHCAMEMTMWRRMEKAVQQQCVVGTRNLCHALSQKRIARLVFASPSEVLGAGTRDAPATEDATTQGSRLRLPGVMLRLQAETIVTEYAAAVKPLGGEVVIVNPTHMLGPWDVSPTFGKLLIEIARRRPVGCSTGGLNVVDVRDVCAGMFGAMHKDAPRRRYILGGHNVSDKELHSKIAAVIGKRRARVTWPSPILTAVGAVGELWGDVTGREPATTKMVSKYIGKQRYFDSKLAHDELKMPCTPLQTTIQDAMDWFRVHERI